MTIKERQILAEVRNHIEYVANIFDYDPHADDEGVGLFIVIKKNTEALRLIDKLISETDND